MRRAACTVMLAPGDYGSAPRHFEPSPAIPAMRDMPDLPGTCSTAASSYTEITPGAGPASTVSPWPAADPMAADLARLLIDSDPGAAHLLLDAAHQRSGAIAPLCALLLEPAARRLGDLWSADDCSEYDVTLGLCRLQSAVRRLDHGPSRTVLPGAPVVLVAPQPGETHLLGAALDAELLWQAGWDMHARFPESDAALQALLSETWFDALDLSLSAAFRREHWLPRITRTIAQARRASRNPALLVVVGGRLFGEERAAGQHVGANLCCRSATHTVPLVLGALGLRTAVAAPA